MPKNTNSCRNMSVIYVVVYVSCMFLVYIICMYVSIFEYDVVTRIHVFVHDHQFCALSAREEENRDRARQFVNQIQVNT